MRQRRFQIYDRDTDTRSEVTGMQALADAMAVPLDRIPMCRLRAVTFGITEEGIYRGRFDVTELS